MPLKKFYGRETEQAILREERELCRNLVASRLVVVTGRRRVGKTELLLQTLREETEVPFVYLFCSRTTSRELIKLWLKAIEQVVELPFNPTFDRLSQVIEFLMFIGKTRPINIAIDECQDLNFIEPTFWSELQRIWDLNKKISRTFLVMSGSVASAMRNIFQAYSEPLYGRVDRFVFVRPFPMDVVSEILSDYVPEHEPDDLLALYTLTGGVVWFIEDLMDRSAFDLDAMSRVAFQPGSKFIMDGEVLLANEFRVDAMVNRSILQAIAHGKTKREELQDRIQDVNISGFLSRLEKQYELIAQNKPVLTPNYRRTRYKMTDRYLEFWFNFVDGQASLLAQNNYEAMRQGFVSAYPTFSGHALEQCFLQTLMNGHRFTEIGPWWDRKGLNEMDIVAINDDEIYFCEVKRSRAKFSLAQLSGKVAAFFSCNDVLRDRKATLCCLSLDDLGKTSEELCRKMQEGGYPFSDDR